MRIATHSSFERGLSTLQRRQGELAEQQEQLTSGKRVARGSDDPAAAARAERAMVAKLRVDADQRAPAFGNRRRVKRAKKFDPSHRLAKPALRR